MFSEKTLRTVEAIVSVHENGRPHGKYESVAVLPDGPGGVRQVTYGAHQATDASNTLDKIIQRYCGLVQAEQGSVSGHPLVDGEDSGVGLVDYLPKLGENTRASFQALAADDFFLDLLRRAGSDPLMIQAQIEIFRENYLQPAISICEKRGYTQPLSLAVIYDSLIHGSFKLISSRVGEFGSNEKLWITRYLVERRNWFANHSKKLLRNAVYRMDTFLNLIIADDVKTVLQTNMVPSLAGKSPAETFCILVMKGKINRQAFEVIASSGNWSLELPIVAHGVSIAESDVS